MKHPFLFLLLSVLTATAASPAPTPEAATNDFFTYLMSSKHDIAQDTAAQNRWLTKDVRNAVATASAASNKAAKAHPGEQIDGVDNGTFLAAWDPPTSFKITETKSTPSTARVDVRYTWGPKTNYPGETRLMTVLLTREDGAWHVNDIHSHASKFNPNSTLLGDLRKISQQR